MSKESDWPSGSYPRKGEGRTGNLVLVLLVQCLFYIDLHVLHGKAIKYPVVYPEREPTASLGVWVGEGM